MSYQKYAKKFAACDFWWLVMNLPLKEGLNFRG